MKPYKSLALLAGILSVFLAFLECTRGKFPSNSPPYFSHNAIITKSSTTGWLKYLSYGAPPEDTILIDECSNIVGFPQVITPEETVHDYGFTTGSYYYNVNSETLPWLYGGVIFMATESTKGGEQAEKRTVMEPDIYKMDGNLLFALNKLKGLNVMRVDEDKKSHFVNGIYIQGYPNELYMKDGMAIVTSVGFEPMTYYDFLLSENMKGQAMSVGTLFQEFLQSKAVFLDTANPEQMDIIQSFNLEGQLIESRIVGNVLYAITFTPTQLYVSSFDFSNRSAIKNISRIAQDVPYSQDELMLAYVHIHITPDLLFVTVPDSQNHTTVLILDISDPNGSISLKGSMKMDGYVLDRFKMDYYEGTFRIITGGWRSPASTLYIYDVSNPSSPALLSQLSVGWRENLYATRFDGKRAYIVTYMRPTRLDPLFVIDLSDPRKPAIAGELVIPGWSQYIEPLGDRLVTLGIDDTDWERKVSVSLFDVSKPSKPSLLDTVSIGNRSSTSYGFADFKAFKVLPDMGLIMLPYTDLNGWWWWGRRVEDAVSLIDLTTNDLTLRGALSSIGTVERPFIQNGDLYVLSQRSFQIADIENRSRPESISIMRTLRPAMSLQANIKSGGRFGLIEDENDWWEVVKMDTKALIPTARLRVNGDGYLRLDESGILAVGSSTSYTNDIMPLSIYPYSSNLSFSSLSIPETGIPFIRACFRFADNDFSPQKYLPLSGDYLGLYGSDGVLLIDRNTWAPNKFISLGASYNYENYSYTSFQNIIAVRNKRIYLTEFESNFDTYKPYLAVLDISNPSLPTLTKFNVPGWPVYVSEDEKRVITIEIEGSDYYLGGVELGDGKIKRGGRVRLNGYPSLAFTDNKAVSLSQEYPYYEYYYYYEQLGTPPTLSVIDITDVFNPAIIRSKTLSAGLWNIAGIEGGYLFLSTGPFTNPARQREMYVSQYAWTDWEMSYLWTALSLNDLSLKHVFPATVSSATPVSPHGRLLVPAGAYGLELLDQ